MSDNAFAYVHNKTLKALLHARAIDHLRTRPYTPRTNGKVERYQQTLQREWAYALEYASSNARRASLPHWVRHYNERRSHSALSNRPPIHPRSGPHRAQQLVLLREFRVVRVGVRWAAAVVGRSGSARASRR